MIKQEIKRIFTENKQRYGYRRILLVLRGKGIKLNHKTVHKLMRSMGLHGKRRKSKYKSYKGEVGKIAANILSRDFAADKPFEKLATDVTEFAVCDDKVYLSPVLDLHNKEVTLRRREKCCKDCSTSYRKAQDRSCIPIKAGNTK